MKNYFKNRLEAIDWIAKQAENEGQFEVLREQLSYNFIYTGTFFIVKNGPLKEVVLLKRNGEP